jgi:hypothetical protein
MPDIVITWNDDAKVSTELLANKYGLARSAQPGYGTTPYYTGNHRPNAFVVARGPGVPAGHVLKDSTILDLAPSILRFFGIPRPQYMTGSALEQLGSTHMQSQRAARTLDVHDPTMAGL